METKKVTDEMRKALKAPLHKDATKPHPTKTYLTAIKPIYVIERLNDVFGVGSWSTESREISVSEQGMVVVHSKLIIPEYGINLEAFGGNDNGGEKSKGFDLGDAFKGAATDALTKMCSYLEIGIEIFKGNGNKESQPQNKTPAQQSASAAKQPSTPAQTKPEEKKDSPIPLIKGTELWDKLIIKLQEKNKTEEDWDKELKKLYVISDAHDAELRDLLWSLPF